MSSLDEKAVAKFKEYLKIPSVQPNCDYNDCVKFLKSYAEELGLIFTLEWLAADKPVVIASWIGSEVKSPSILLSSHMDVVPVFVDKWTYEPFAAEEDDAGNIYARGSQDMKCVGIQYLEAIRRLILQGYQPKRTVHICFTPDEEIGSQGMKLFVQTDAFKKLNIGCELDEGVASPNEEYNLYYGERTCYKLVVICSGTPGHGSLLHDNTAGEKISIVINKFMEKRSEEKQKLKDNPNLTLGDVTTINMTMLEGGVQTNVVPPELRAVFDCRVSLNYDHDEFEKWIDEVCKQAGEGVRVEIQDKKKRIEPTRLSDKNPWWVALKSQFDQMGVKVNTQIFPAATDARYIRGLGIPAFGFSPMNNTPVLLHDHDEFLNRKVFLNGIQIYVKLISALADV
ncbi:aminoacylase-1-like [Macrosteles quadrilineatus]|uniref:aminoacylase-1-like n=1 Tax=Macrosteles quadrilineatus TaxID=74068 RepID=UPI0023E2DEE7|nr:aminoacylase-1-like [Macrosteles quadrilineatus]